VNVGVDDIRVLLNKMSGGLAILSYNRIRQLEIDMMFRRLNRRAPLAVGCRGIES